MNNHEHQISDLLKVVFEQLDMVDAVQELDVQRAYHGVVGGFISKLTKEVRFDDGVLRVKLLSAALRNELSYKKQDLINKINAALKAQVVKQIILQ